MSDAFEVLSRDHDELKRMLLELETGPTMETGATAPQLAARKKLAGKLLAEGSRHEAVEEEYFWPAVRERLAAGDRLADEAARQEQDARAMLDRIGKLDASDPGFEKLLAAFVVAGREHIAFEETRVWPAMRMALNIHEAAELGEKLESGKPMAPARPYPGVPPEAGLLGSAGQAATGGLRDVMTSRGER
jgi:hypothetical protein